MASPIAIAAAFAALVFVLIVALVAALRHRDPIGRAIAGHASVVGALRDSATRATDARSGSAPSSSRARDQAARAGVTLIPSAGEKGQPDR
jgi:hypothetical protein